MPKVLYFGNLPKWIGGRQTSGAAVVMWQLARSINGLNTDCKLEFVATDVFDEKKQVDNTIVFGWNYFVFIKNFFLSFLSSIQYLFIANRVAKNNQFPFFSVLVKMIFFNSIVKKNKQALFHVHGTDYFVIVKEILNLNLINDNQLLYTIHAIGGIDTNITGYKIERQKEKKIAEFNFGNLFFVSKELQKEWNTFYGFKQSVVISNAIADEYLNVVVEENMEYSSSRIILITIGSLSERKGQVRVLEAISKSINKKRFIYKCIGNAENAYLQQLKLMAENNDVDFEFLGIMGANEIITVLRKAHYMILPSSSEGFGLVYLESLCIGTPVILPKELPVIKEISLNGANSIFLDDYTANSILSVLDSIDDYNFENNKVAESFLKLSWKDVAKEYVEHYNVVYEKIRKGSN